MMISVCSELIGNFQNCPTKTGAYDKLRSLVQITSRTQDESFDNDTFCLSFHRLATYTVNVNGNYVKKCMKVLCSET